MHTLAKAELSNGDAASVPLAGWLCDCHHRSGTVATSSPIGIDLVIVFSPPTFKIIAEAIHLVPMTNMHADNTACVIFVWNSPLPMLQFRS